MIPGLRTLRILLHTPLVPPPPGPPTMELSTLTRPRASSRTFSQRSIGSVVSRPYPLSRLESGAGSAEGARRWASDKGRKELYSDEAGSVGAGIDDVAHTDAAFNKDPNPKSASKQIEKETGKDFTKQSPTSEDYNDSPQKAGEGGEKPLRTGKSDAGKL